MILAGDIGGTKANLGLFAPEAGEAGAGGPGRLRLVSAATFATADFPGLAEVIAEFLQRPREAGSDVGVPVGGVPAGGEAPAGGAGLAGPRQEVAAACFGVAGPVVDNRSSTPNLAWDIDGRALARGLRLPAVQLINDLVATAEGIPLLAADEVATLQAGAAEAASGAEPASGVGPASGAGPASEGEPRDGNAEAAAGNQVLIAAGTGLGMALLPVVGGTRVTVPSEGGHADYAPRDEDETALLLYLRRRFGEHVSTERVVSGPGLRVIYEHLLAAGYAPENPEVRAALAAGDPARVVAEAALSGGDRLCSRALDMFIAAYGAAAGNLALIGTALGGVYIGGGIAPKILPRLTGGLFLRAFLDKGRFAGYLERIPVRVVLNDRAAMLGAARCAAAMLQRMQRMQRTTTPAAPAVGGVHASAGR